MNMKKTLLIGLVILGLIGGGGILVTSVRANTDAVDYVVSNTWELENAIDSNRHIILRDGRYECGKISLVRVENLTIEAEHPGKVELVSRDGYKPVISLSNCKRILISGCIIGHQLAQYDCGEEGDVIAVNNSSDIRVENCDLYGCGVTGGELYYSNHVVFTDCVIRDCQYYAVWALDCGDVLLKNCVITGNGYMYPDYAAVIGGRNVTVQNCMLFNNRNTQSPFARGEVEYNGCLFEDNAWEDGATSAYGICINGLTWQVSDGKLWLGFPITLESGTVIESESLEVLDYSPYALPWKHYESLEKVYCNGLNVNYNLQWTAGKGKCYWYENGIKQGTYEDPKGVKGDGVVRGREIYDPDSDGWYWLDAVYNGAKACSKEVWVPYIFQEEGNWNDEAAIVENTAGCGDMAEQVARGVREKTGKWVRYDADGKMYKRWYTVEGTDAKIYPDQVGNTYYYDPITGLMAKGTVVIEGVTYQFDEITGALIR